MAHKIAIIGPNKLTGGFKALGVECFDAEDGTAALAALAEIRGKGSEARSEYAVAILLERIAKEIPEDEYNRATSGPLPAVVVIPDVEISSGRGLAKLKHLAERAVGSNILE